MLWRKSWGTRLVFVLLLAGLLTARAQAEPTAGYPPPPIAGIETVQDCPTCPVLVTIPAGILTPDEAPPRPVAPFLIGQTEVTFDQWAACVTEKACRSGQDDHGWGRGTRPMINVAYADAMDYVNWLSRKTGRSYRLPSEDEWEWAARGGTTTLYWWGDDPGTDKANCRNCGGMWGGHMTAPVASFKPNPFGLYDTAGNVWEWTSTCWHKDRAASVALQDCQHRAARGGAWYYIPQQSRSSARARHAIAMWSYTLGFRVAAEP